MSEDRSRGSNPVIDLVRQRMAREGLDRRALGERLAEGGNLPKALRRLDELLQGERIRPEVLRQVANSLGIPPEQLAVACEALEKRERELLVAANRRAVVEAMERRGPHLWGRLPRGYHPSLITVLGPEFYLLVRLPAEIVELPQYEQMREVGEIASEHYQEHRRCRLVGYDYRRSVHEDFRFDVEGRYMGRVDGGFRVSRNFVKIGGRTIDRPHSVLERT